MSAHILEARGLRVARPGPAPDLKLELLVYAGELHLVFCADPQTSTALADVLLGLSDAAGGEVRFHGEAWSDLVPREAYRLRGKVGRVMSDGNWIDNRSVTENLLLPLRHHTVLPEEVLQERACDYARRFGLPGLPLDLPGQCNRADLARAACIRAFLGRPELIILEHPLAFADTGLLPPLVDAIQEARQRHAALIWFTASRTVLEAVSGLASRRHRITGRQLLELEPGS